MAKDIKKVLVIGSGPIIIGQAAEFDYAGTQACRALKEEGVEVVLINSNPATIMTDEDIADRVYVEPISLEYVTAVIKKERPDGLLATLGGQVGLNMAVELSRAGVLKTYDVTLLGTDLAAIQEAEDRELFKKAMKDIDQPVARKATLLKTCRPPWTLPGPSAIPSLYDRRTPWAAPAAALPIRKRNSPPLPHAASNSVRFIKFWWNGRWPDGKKSNMKSCGIKRIIVLLSAIWKTLTR